MKHLLKPVTGKGLWAICYRGSENGYSSQAFHKACDNKGPTVTLVRAGNNVFGGYTDKSWNGNTGWINTKNAFLFQANKYIKMQASVRPQHAMYSALNLNPFFGNGMRMYDKCNTKKSSYSYPGYAYQLPASYSYGQLASRELLAGSYNFYCNEYEVYTKGKKDKFFKNYFLDMGRVRHEFQAYTCKGYN